MVKLYSVATLSCVMSFINSFSQNLIVNPGAEATPFGTGWSVILTGGSCAAGTAAGTYNNWTMAPDNTANYPAAHGGTRTFFAGCGLVGQGPFELRQDIDVSGDATQIDLLNVNYVFSGYINTPIAAQGDAGRFIVEYLSATDVVLGTSYNVVQSGTGGSGIGWNFYTNTRLAPVGTRKVRIRLITTLVTGPAINAYFDDVSLMRAYIVPLPIKLEGFTGRDSSGHSILHWSVSDAVNFDRFEIQRSTTGNDYQPAGTVAFTDLQSGYRFSEISDAPGKLYYRLKLIDRDGKFSYSPVVVINSTGGSAFNITPNPSRGAIRVTGLRSRGIFIVSDLSGRRLYQANVRSTTLRIDDHRFSKGVYMATYIDGREKTTRKLIID